MFCTNCSKEMSDDRNYGAKVGGGSVEATRNTCKKCGEAEAEACTVYLGKNTQSGYEFIGDREVFVCGACVRRHGQTRLQYGMLMIAAIVLLAALFVPPLVFKIQENANMSFGDMIAFMFTMCVIGLALGLVVTGIQYIALSARGKAALASDLARELVKAETNGDNHVTGVRPPKPDYLYGRLSHTASSVRIDAARALLRYNK